MAWRFLPEDFRMASVYGNPEGASLADWPVSYADMEPYYSRAELELGVAGSEGNLTTRTPRSTRYPLPAFGTEPARELLAGAAERLGWGWGPIPLALNSEPHDGRPACVRCPQCVGHACPVDAKNGSHNTFLPRAAATGNCDVLYDAEAIEIQDGSGDARVTVMANTSGDPVRLDLRADVVVVAAGAVETARLLLASGIGNDHIGRHLHDHRFATVAGTVTESVKPYRGPGHCHRYVGSRPHRLDPVGRRSARRPGAAASLDRRIHPGTGCSCMGQGAQGLDGRPACEHARRLRDWAGDPDADVAGDTR
jgi:choline dehydrogenase-like flavoprotein